MSGMAESLWWLTFLVDLTRSSWITGTSKK